MEKPMDNRVPNNVKDLDVLLEEENPDFLEVFTYMTEQARCPGDLRDPERIQELLEKTKFPNLREAGDTVWYLHSYANILSNPDIISSESQITHKEMEQRLYLTERYHEIGMKIQRKAVADFPK